MDFSYKVMGELCTWVHLLKLKASWQPLPYHSHTTDLHSPYHSYKDFPYTTSIPLTYIPHTTPTRIFPIPLPYHSHRIMVYTWYIPGI